MNRPLAALEFRYHGAANIKVYFSSAKLPPPQAYSHVNWAAARSIKLNKVSSLFLTANYLNSTSSNVRRVDRVKVRCCYWENSNQRGNAHEKLAHSVSPPALHPLPQSRRPMSQFSGVDIRENWRTKQFFWCGPDRAEFTFCKVQTHKSTPYVIWLYVFFPTLILGSFVLTLLPK